MGLAFRKLDVFGYYFCNCSKKYQPSSKQRKYDCTKAKAFSNFAFKGIAGIVVAIYVVLFGFSFWQITDLNKKIAGYEEVKQTHELKTLERNKYLKEKFNG